MADLLPRLRSPLELMPSPIPEQPGVLVRDPFRYSQALVIVPPPLVALLALFDGEHTELDLRAALVRATGELQVGALLERLRGTLSQSGFLEDETFERLRDQRRRAFAEATRRAPAHAGGAYPADARELRRVLAAYLDGAGEASPIPALVGIAAPHVSLEGGSRSYRAAYAALLPEHRESTFVILGTSHYGEPNRFGLTAKPFLTPLGETAVDCDAVAFLTERGGAAVVAEDYCHAVEHSIELQVVFLQQLFGPSPRLVPVLCGPLLRGEAPGERPEDEPAVARFLGALAELAARERERLLWVIGVDMAHVGRRYGDSFDARAGRGPLSEVAERDQARIARLVEGDASGFWELVRGAADDLKWCGAAPLYVFLRAAGPVRGVLRRYEQWNIDPASVVSFAGLAFRRA